MYDSLSQRLTVYTLACIEFSSKVAGETKNVQLSSTLERLESWYAWDDISAVANHGVVMDYLLNAHNGGNGPNVRLHSISFVTWA